MLPGIDRSDFGFPVGPIIGDHRERDPSVDGASGEG
jgi:hypothetical protein